MACKLKGDIKSKELYKFYKEKYSDKAVNMSIWAKVWKEFIDVRLKMTVFDNLEFTMPHRVGSLRIKVGGSAYKIKKNGELDLKINFGATKKKWLSLYPDKTWKEILDIEKKPIIYYTNEHTDGKVLHWHWDKTTVNFKNKTLYRINMVRKWSRLVNKKIVETKKYDYYE